MAAAQTYQQYSKEFNLNQLITFRGNIVKHWARKGNNTPWHYLINTRTMLSEILSADTQEPCGSSEKCVFSAIQNGAGE